MEFWHTLQAAKRQRLFAAFVSTQRSLGITLMIALLVISFDSVFEIDFCVCKCESIHSFQVFVFLLILEERYLWKIYLRDFPINKALFF